MSMNMVQPHGPRDGYDVMQVCQNGHKITEYATTQPISKEAFCSRCGAPTITACESCGKPIRGYRHIPGVFSAQTRPVPKYCDGCGMAYAWQAAALENLREVLAEGGLSDEDIATAEQALPDIMKDTPRTDLASHRFEQVLGKLGKPLYEIAIKVVSDIASETAKKAMGLG